MSSKRVLGVIGGSGVYGMDALGDLETVDMETPWGAPSDALQRGVLGGVDMVFLARHGRGHRLTPGEINYRANIDALKRAGVTDIISISACGSFREHLAPGVFVVVDQYIDRTTLREKSFFGEGFVAHVSMADPVCPGLADVLASSCDDAGVSVQRGGVYIAIDGPQFSTKAESALYRSWGCDVIGMTNMPEAKLAREAELPYASLAMVTDYDCWHEREKPVEVSDVLAIMAQNTANAAKVLGAAVRRLGPARTPSPLGIEKTLDAAVITPREARNAETTKKLDAIAGRFLASER
ncbi:MAG: S-methyl-5'-thioadenosine phosphorylase [Pseudomonadota bacterium]